MLKQITIVSDRKNWINDHIPKWLPTLKEFAEEIIWVHEVSELTVGDMAFFLGCEQIVPRILLSRNRHNLVVHASDLPKGKGWSPLTWQILNGDNEIPVVLFEAAEKVDDGPIYIREQIVFEGTELIDEMRLELGRKTIALCNRFLREYPTVIEQAQDQHGESTYYPRRTPADSRLDPDLSIREQFRLMRVADNDRYPCYFELDGSTFEVKVERRR
jgi:methionyl-tRNA formyltransferase